MYRVNAKKVLWNGNKIFVAPGIIRSSIPFDSNLVIRYMIDISDREKYSIEERCRNILSIDSSGNLLWKIEAPPKETLGFNSSYLKLSKSKDGTFIAYDGACFISFDPSSGKIVEREFTK